MMMMTTMTISFWDNIKCSRLQVLSIYLCSEYCDTFFKKESLAWNRLKLIDHKENEIKNQYVCLKTAVLVAASLTRLLLPTAVIDHRQHQWSIYRLIRCTRLLQNTRSLARWSRPTVVYYHQFKWISCVMLLMMVFLIVFIKAINRQTAVDTNTMQNMLAC